MISPDLSNTVEQAVDDCYALAEQKLMREFTRPSINFKQRGKIAGSARLQHNELRFNPILLRDNLELFLREVIPHEIAHLLCFTLHGRVRPHGAQWKNIMLEVFDLRGKAYHAMDVSKVRGASYPYYCDCGPVELGIRRHNKVLKKQQQYRCRRCGESLSQAPARMI